MRPSTLDATAGRTAREIYEHPEIRHRIRDITDPRYGELVGSGATQRIFDPTDPRYGGLLDSRQ